MRASDMCKYYIYHLFLTEVMKPYVLYYSLSGNTRRFSETISETLKIPVFDLTTSEPSVIEECDLLILGTPVHGFSPARPVLSFVEEMPEGKGKKAIIFCTYALRKGNALKKLETKLANKGYNVILGVSKRGLKLGKQDFSNAIHEIAKVLEKH
jgi:flavodoxin